MGFESASCMETKEFCGATWPSKELKRKERNSYCPLIAPQKFFISPATHSRRGTGSHGSHCKRSTFHRQCDWLHAVRLNCAPCQTERTVWSDATARKRAIRKRGSRP